jgi:hypothetical protein
MIPDMSRELRRQYGNIKSPWADYAVYSFPDASRISHCDWQPLMDAMNSIIAINWKATEPHWTAASSPFDGKFSLILVYDGSGLVAFSVYRKLLISGGLAIYRSGTEVLPMVLASFTDGGREIPSYGRPTPRSAKKLRPPCSATPRTPPCRRPASRCVRCFIPASASRFPA